MRDIIRPVIHHITTAEVMSRNAWLAGWLDGWMDGGRDGWMDVLTYE